MKKFIKADLVAYPEQVNTEKIDKFIDKFNTNLSRGKFTLNDGLDNIPHLNDNEFGVAVNMAKEEGWILTRFDDNYNTTSYKMEKSK
jgi:hypothetical protein